MSLKYFYIVYFLGLTGVLFAQDLQFTAVASKNKLGLNQKIKIEYTVNQNGTDDFTPPDFKGFKIIAGPSTSVRQSWVNGVSSYAQSYIYFLQPTAKGTFTIPNATITFDGVKYKSNSLTIAVTDAVEEPKNPNDPTYLAQENIFLVAHVSKDNPYVGESIYVEYRLYFSDKIEFSDAQFGDAPKYEGFWNQEIPINGYNREVGDFKGERYNYFTLKKAVLIPQKDGKLSIDPIDMDILVGVPTGKYDFFGYPLIQRTQAHYTSGAKTISVRPLPENGKPDDFTGAVGDYTFSVKSNKNTLGANQTATIAISVQGVGNLKLFDLPKLKTPADLEVYSPERKENIQTTLNGLKGSVTDNYALVANYKGKYAIPSVSFSYFNPKTGKYQTFNSEEFIIEVTEGTSSDTLQAGDVTKRRVTASGGDFHYIATQTKFTSAQRSDFYGSVWHYALSGLPFLCIPLFLLVLNRKKSRDADIIGNKIRNADRLSKKYLSEAKKHLGNKELFYEALEKALHNFLKAKLNVETSDISQDKIAEILQQRQVSDAAIYQFKEIINDCDLARYTPLVKSDMESELKKAGQVITLINNELV